MNRILVLYLFFFTGLFTNQLISQNIDLGIAYIGKTDSTYLLSNWFPSLKITRIDTNSRKYYHFVPSNYFLDRKYYKTFTSMVLDSVNELALIQHMTLTDTLSIYSDLSKSIVLYAEWRKELNTQGKLKGHSLDTNLYKKTVLWVDTTEDNGYIFENIFKLKKCRIYRLEIEEFSESLKSSIVSKEKYKRSGKILIDYKTGNYCVINRKNEILYLIVKTKDGILKLDQNHLNDKEFLNFIEFNSGFKICFKKAGQ